MRGENEIGNMKTCIAFIPISLTSHLQRFPERM
jgi:hypothetical protein